MAQAESERHLGSLEIISKVNQIVDQNKGVDETLNQIIEVLRTFEELPNPVFTRIVFNSREYKTPGFVETGHCRERSFKTHSGKIGHFHLCIQKDNSQDEEDKKSEQFFFLNNIVSILLRFLNQAEGTRSLKKTKKAIAEQESKGYISSGVSSAVSQQAYI